VIYWRFLYDTRTSTVELRARTLPDGADFACLHVCEILPFADFENRSLRNLVMARMEDQLAAFGASPRRPGSGSLAP
jgi:hypothetical protein